MFFCFFFFFARRWVSSTKGQNGRCLPPEKMRNHRTNPTSLLKACCPDNRRFRPTKGLEKGKYSSQRNYDGNERGSRLFVQRKKKNICMRNERESIGCVAWIFFFVKKGERESLPNKRIQSPGFFPSAEEPQISFCLFRKIFVGFSSKGAKWFFSQKDFILLVKRVFPYSTEGLVFD